MGLLDRFRSGRDTASDAATGVVLFTADRPPLLDDDLQPPPSPASVPAEGPPPVPAAPPAPAPRSIIDHQPMVGQQPVAGEPNDAVELLSSIAAENDLSPRPAPPRPPTATRPTPTPLPPREPPQVEWSKAEHDEPEVFEVRDDASAPADDDGLLDQFAGLLDGLDEPEGPKAA